MSISKQNRRYAKPRGFGAVVFALILVIGAIFLFGTTAYAAGDTSQDEPVPTEAEATLIVKEVWLTGDTLHINVAERGSGEEQTLELNLRDYAKAADEYVTVQATDSGGRTSNSVTFKNPYYEPTATPEPATPSDTSESAVSDGEKPAGADSPLTPDGTGTVLDNVTDDDGKEFFTVETPDGNTFYLIVDRQRDSDNVYLLNAVNEDDLASLAKPGDGKSVSAIPTPEVTETPEPQTTAEPAPTPEPEPQKSGGNTGTIAFIVIAVVIFGGAAYYFKIVRPKKSGASEPEFEPEDDFDDEEIDVESDDEDGDDE
jgi:hypothetical protein